MAVPSILLFFVVSHLLLLHSAGCPESFDCGTPGQIQIPYTNFTHNECGSVTVDCSKSLPDVILGENMYEVTSPLEDDYIKIKDRELERPGVLSPCKSRLSLFCLLLRDHQQQILQLYSVS
ncbi:hypothetical protein Acr_25g0004620 [Actinidia rufa]|uniref:Wall-associated receptor kinase galacturonan-binding domain-containing protein n=1 Tax=Actinidia rufa TaxID=165716 RepID=A0A7J0GZ00_9ERIC|nr:hypothetical protein Acr_25g0004620 [Actinidia rufa]